MEAVKIAEPAAPLPTVVLPPVAPAWARWASTALLLLLTAALVDTGRRMIVPDRPLPDFEYFYKAGAWLLAHGGLDGAYDRLPDGSVLPRGSIPWYLPFVSRFFTLLAPLPYPVAAWTWLLVNAAALLVTLRLIAQHLMGLPRQDWPVVQLVPLILLFGAWVWEFRLNQLDGVTLLLLTAAYVHWQRGRAGPAGLWLGLAVLLKLTPALLVVWFALKRQFRVVGFALATIVLAGPIGDVIVFGPTQAASEYRAWLRQAVSAGSHRGLIVSGQEMDWRNQATGAVLARWLAPVSYSTRFDNDPRLTGFSEEPRYLNIASLRPETVAMIHLIGSGLAGLALLWLARRPAAQLTPWQLRLEWALFVLAMLWFMPVMRRYHVVLALPAVSLLAAALHYVGHRGTWARLTALCIVASFALQLMLAAQSAQLGEKAGGSLLEARGAILAATLLLGVPLIVLLRRLRRRPHLLPPDPYLPAGAPGLTAGGGRG
jgi:hypothetical protein